MDTVTYPDSKVISFISEKFVTAKVEFYKEPEVVQRFGAQWTPSILVLDAEGGEHHRLIGYLPPEDFLGELQLGLARLAFDAGDFEAAEKHFEATAAACPKSLAAPQALYWQGVALYKATKDPANLRGPWGELQTRYPDSDWFTRCSFAFE